MRLFMRHRWWSLLIRGIILILFGIFALAMPALTFATLIGILALYLIVDGVVEFLIGLVSASSDDYWLVSVIEGILQVALGIWVIKYPITAAYIVVIFIGILFILSGIAKLTMSGREEYSESSGLFVFSGVLSIIAGIIILFKPISSTIALAWVLGIYALIAGPILIAIAITLKSKFNEIKTR